MSEPQNEPENDLENVHFGYVGKPRTNWRQHEALGDAEVDPDDEDLAESPPDVVSMLGFDPLTYAAETLPQPAVS